jgi:hypothetical protein
MSLIHVEVPEAVLDQAEKLAKLTHVPLDQIASEALQDRVLAHEQEAWFDARAQWERKVGIESDSLDISGCGSRTERPDRMSTDPADDSTKSERTPEVLDYGGGETPDRFTPQERFLLAFLTIMFASVALIAVAAVACLAFVTFFLRGFQR